MIQVYAFWAIFSLIPGIFFSTWLLSLERMGFPLQDAAVTYAYFSLGQAIFELPTGFLADTWGRKRVTLIGLIFYFIGFGSVAFVDSIAWIYFLLVVVGFGQTLISGAYQAWFLDVVEKKNRAISNHINEHRFFLALDLIRRVNLALGAWLGASLINWSASSVWIVLAGASLIALLSGIFVSTDNVRELTKKSDQIKVSYSGIKENLANPLLLGLLALGFFYGIETGNRDTIMQPYIVNFLGHGNTYGMVVIQSGVAILGILGNRLAAALRRHRSDVIGTKEIAMLVSPLFVMGFAQMFAANVSSLLLFSVLYFTGMITIGWFYPTQAFFLNTVIKKEHRAFLLSAASMFECGTQAVTCILISKSLGEMSINRFWSVGAFALFMAAGVMLFGYAIFRQKSRHRTSLLKSYGVVHELNN